LLLEVVAYVADEAACGHGEHCEITLFAEGSISVADDGRGTDTQRDAEGRVVKKPVLSSKDLRFFDSPTAQVLPDGQPRRGMSVVAALSDWLTHVNRRVSGSWHQRYERGVLVTDLVEIPDDGTTGTKVHFRPDGSLAGKQAEVVEIERLTSQWEHLTVVVRDHRD
jgi:DNA gyrase subunit B